MYFAMDEIGRDATQTLCALASEKERWAFLEGLAYGMGFQGIHLTPGLYRSFGLSLGQLPASLRAFRLTYHAAGGTCGEAYTQNILQGIALAGAFGMEDVSFHPPYAEGLSIEGRREADAWLRRYLPGWLALAADSGISLTIESHVTGDYFLYRGYEAFTRMTDDFPALGILIDVSHNGFDGYATREIIDTFQGRPVRGLHLSDADTSMGFPQGTHLPVGRGLLDFDALLGAFGARPDLYGVLEIKADLQDVAASLRALQAIGDRLEEAKSAPRK